MSIRFRISVCVLLLLAGSFSVARELISVTASVDRQTAYIGDLIKYSIKIKYDSTVTLTPPAVGANLGGFEVKNYNVAEEVRLDDGSLLQSMDFTIRTFTTGEYVIPPLPVEYMLPDSTFKYISANPIKIDIKSILADENSDTLQIKPLKPQASLERERSELWFFVILGALLLGGGWTAYYFYRKSRLIPVEYVDPRSEWEIACTDLALLKESDYLSEGNLKKFYIELSEIIRKYLGRRFDFLSTDLTTGEIDMILTSMIVDLRFQSETIQFLIHSDLVKFAKFVPDMKRAEDDWQIAYDLITLGRDLVIHRKTEVDNSQPVLQPVAVESEFEYADPMLKYAPPELRQRLADRSADAPSADEASLDSGVSRANTEQPDGNAAEGEIS